jgi:hypothetical protein
LFAAHCGLTIETSLSRSAVNRQDGFATGCDTQISKLAEKVFVEPIPMPAAIRARCDGGCCTRLEWEWF